MKQLRIHRYSKDFSGLRLETVEKPTVSRDRPVLVRVKVTSLNPVDLKMATGESKALAQGALPLPLGVDFCGTVEEIHGDIPDFSVGDHVIGYTGIATPRAFSDLIIVHPSEIAVIDRTIPFEELGATPLNALTAYQALRFGGVTRGSRVLIHGGAGGVGSMAIQIANRLGAHIISTAKKRDFDFLRSIGANDCIDYETDDFSMHVRDVDFILDILGGKVLKKSERCLKPGATLVSTSAPPAPEDLKRAGIKLNSFLRIVLQLLNGASLRRARRGHYRFKALVTTPNAEDLQSVARLIESGVRARIGVTLKLDELTSFLKKSVRNSQGKILIMVNNHGTL